MWVAGEAYIMPSKQMENQKLWKYIKMENQTVLHHSIIFLLVTGFQCHIEHISLASGGGKGKECRLHHQKNVKEIIISIANYYVIFWLYFRCFSFAWKEL